MPNSTLTELRLHRENKITKPAAKPPKDKSSDELTTTHHNSYCREQELDREEETW